jgi:hypothetical protein
MEWTHKAAAKSFRIVLKLTLDQSQIQVREFGRANATRHFMVFTEPFLSGAKKLPRNSTRQVGRKWSDDLEREVPAQESTIAIRPIPVVIGA